MRGLYPHISSCSLLGDRNSQQDYCAYEVNHDMLCAVLCDGMGGMSGGELASRTGAETVLERFRNAPPPSIQSSAEWLQNAMRLADRNIAALRDESGEVMKAGSTAVAVLVSEGMLQWTCVGDSRIYAVRGGRLTTLTRMHNYNLQLKDMYRSGEIDERDMEEQSRRGEALISYLGMDGLSIIDTGAAPVDLLENDVIVLVSDGAYKSLDDMQVLALIEEAWLNPELIARRLCNEACRLGRRKQDNTTAVAIVMTRTGGR